MKILILANHYLTLRVFRRELIQKLSENHEVVISIPEGEKTTYYDIQYDEEENTYSIIEIYSKEEKTADELNSMTVKYIYSDSIRDSEPDKNI